MQTIILNDGFILLADTDVERMYFKHHIGKVINCTKDEYSIMISVDIKQHGKD